MCSVKNIRRHPPCGIIRVQGRGNCLAWLVVTSNSTAHLYIHKNNMVIHFPVVLEQLDRTTCWAQRDFLECLISYQGFVVKAYSGVVWWKVTHVVYYLKCNTSLCVWVNRVKSETQVWWTLDTKIRYDVCVCGTAVWDGWNVDVIVPVDDLILGPDFQFIPPESWSLS